MDLINKEILYLESKIPKQLNAMRILYSEIRYKEGITANDNYELNGEINELADQFKDLAEMTYKICLVYFETKNLKEYLTLFRSEILPRLKKDVVLEEYYDTEMGEMESSVINSFWDFLYPFSAFSFDINSMSVKKTGIEYLENILESSGIIINALKIKPTTETQVYDAVKIVLKSVFPTHISPSESFQKTAKNYKPDILLPSLNCAIEYKYAENERRLIETIDQILIDVKGYDKHLQYKFFYAVFYVKTGIWTKKRFEQVWEEKEFPKNWKGVLVEGI